jgi:hypothetical protein
MLALSLCADMTLMSNESSIELSTPSVETLISEHLSDWQRSL